MSEPEHFRDAIEAYRRCVADTSFVRSEWVAAGRPVMQTGANGIAGVHPLLKAVHECEAIANRLRGELELTPRTANRRGPDRPSGAANAPDRVSRVGLRSVESAQHYRDRVRVAGPPDENLSAGGAEQVEPRRLAGAEPAALGRAFDDDEAPSSSEDGVGEPGVADDR
jgi:hypothetical protein